MRAARFHFDDAFNGYLWNPAAGHVEPVAAGSRERLVLRDPEPWPRGDFWPAQRDQLCARRTVHAGRHARLDGPQLFRLAVLGDAGARSADRRSVRHADRTIDAALAVQARSSVWAAADVRPYAGGGRRVPFDLRRVRPVVRRALGAIRRD